MIPSSGFKQPNEIKGWLGQYLDICGRNRYPWTYHLLGGLFALSSIMGRQTHLKRSTYVLYPPISILLLGPSGVGKSQSLKLAASVVAAGSRGLTPFVTGHGPFTTASKTKRWVDIQKKEKSATLEGIHTLDEFSAILTHKTGNETTSQWLIQALEHDTLEDDTLNRGHNKVTGMTIAFGFATTMDYLRDRVSVLEFSGGLMHRFLIAHEMKLDDRAEEEASIESIEALGASARALREQAPPEMEVEAKAGRQLLAYRRQAEDRHYASHHLSGFWNRYEGILAKLAMVFALSQASETIRVEHIELAERLVRQNLYPPLEAIIDQLAAGPRMARFFSVAESLLAAGPEGWPMETLFRKLNSTTRKDQRESLQALQSMGLIWVLGNQVYGKQKWRDNARS